MVWYILWYLIKIRIHVNACEDWPPYYCEDWPLRLFSGLRLTPRLFSFASGMLPCLSITAFRCAAFSSVLFSWNMNIMFCDINIMFSIMNIMFCNMHIMFCDMNFMFSIMSIMFCNRSIMFCDMDVMFYYMKIMFCNRSIMFCRLKVMFWNITIMFGNTCFVFVTLTSSFVKPFNSWFEILCFVNNLFILQDFVSDHRLSKYLT